MKFQLEQIPAALRATTVGLTKILEGIRTFAALHHPATQPAEVPA